MTDNPGRSKSCKVDSGEGNNQKQKQKQKGKGKGKAMKIPTNIPKKDHFQRVTYLYKLGHMMSMKSNNNKTNDTLSRSYLNHMDLVSKKAVLKLHPDIKRTICKKCSRFQNIGLNCSLRIRNNSKKQLDKCDILELECRCKEIKRFPIGSNPEYELFSERQDRLFEMESKSK